MGARRKYTPEGYISIADLAHKLEEKGLHVSPASLHYRFDHGEIPGVRDDADIRRRRLVEESAVTEVILYYEKISVVKKSKRSLSDLATELDLKDKTLYAIAKRKNIPAARWGSRRVLTEFSFDQWKDRLKEESESQKSLQERYLTTGQLAKELGSSHYMMLHWIKKNKIPAKKINGHYLIEKKDYEKHGKEWKSAFIAEKEERERKKSEYISRMEISRRWGVNVWDIYKAIKEGDIPTIEESGESYVRRSEFEKHEEDWKRRCNI